MPTPGDVYGDANLDGKFTLTDYLFAQEYYNGATSIGCRTQGGSGCQPRSGLITWQQAQLRPVADPAAPTGGRDLAYLFNTYAGKLRFVIEVDFRSSIDFLYMGVRLVDRSGVAPFASDTR
jgi:hypothetical protein